jgi:hypothetical protein
MLDWWRLRAPPLFPIFRDDDAHHRPPAFTGIADTMNSLHPGNATAIRVSNDTVVANTTGFIIDRSSVSLGNTWELGKAQASIMNQFLMNTRVSGDSHLTPQCVAQSPSSPSLPPSFLCYGVAPPSSFCVFSSSFLCGVAPLSVFFVLTIPHSLRDQGRRWCCAVLCCATIGFLCALRVPCELYCGTIWCVRDEVALCLRLQKGFRCTLGCS